MLTRLITGFIALSLTLTLLPGAAAPAVHAQKNTPAPVTSVAAIVFPGTKTAPAQFGVYLGSGLVLTNWHPWTLDGRDYTTTASRIAANRRVTRYTADGVDDPGERLLDTALCDGAWTPLSASSATCEPFARIAGAGVIFPLANDTLDSVPVPVEQLIYASREYDIALFRVDAQAVEARGAASARLSLLPSAAHQAVSGLSVTADGSLAFTPTAIASGTPALLPEQASVRGLGPWRVPSLVLDSGGALLEGAPVFDVTSGSLIGLAWRASDSIDSPAAWITPAALWAHDLFAANATLSDPALAAVLDAAVSAPVTAPSTLSDPLAAPLGNAGIDVQHVDLDLTIDHEAGTLSGTATLTIRATYHDLGTFSLDAHLLDVTRVTVDGQDAAFVTKTHKLVIDLPQPVAFGTEFTVAIDYSAAPTPYRSAYLPFFDIGMFFRNGQVATLNEPDGAQTWFPCNDHPSDRATYDIRLSVVAPLVAVSNGELVETTDHDDGTSTFHWTMRAPMATYLVIVAVANYVPVGQAAPDGTPITHYVYAGQEQAASQVFSYTDDALEHFATLFGPYPFDRYGHVVVPEHGMALETQTMTTMPDTLLSSSELGAFNIMVHELAHQWFGNTVSLATWSDIWLNEGFATYAEWLASEYRFGEQAALAARSASEQALISDGRTTPLIDPAPEELLSFASYHKGAWLLHMLRRELGDEMFFTVLRAYVQTYRDMPADSLGFWLLAEEVSGQELAPFFEQWLLQGGVPRYTLYWTSTDAGADTLLCPDGLGAYQFALTVRFAEDVREFDVTLSTAPDAARASHTLPFAPKTAQPDPAQHVLAQVQVQPIASLPEECP